MNTYFIQPTDALIVVDAQPDFVDGALAVPDAISIARELKELLGMEWNTIVATQDWHPVGHKSFASANGAGVFTAGFLNGIPQVFWPDHCVQGTPGAELDERLVGDTTRFNAVIRKGTNPEVDSYSGFIENDGVTSTGLAGYLKERGVTRVFVCGLATDYCVGFTALDALKKGFDVVLLPQASRGISKEGVNAMLQRVRESGGGVWDALPNHAPGLG
jgi:nicotinamidase/pyrazinamidase